MNIKQNHYEKVTLLITHYNRSESLERLLTRFNETNTSFHEIIVSDDGSKSEHRRYLDKIRERFNFKLVTTETNKGLGNNINKGQDAVSTPYTLYVQEDFVPLKPFDDNFLKGYQIMEGDLTLDTVRFYSYLNYPHLKPYRDGFSEMIFKPLSRNLDRFPLYSDHPHLRRSDFLRKFGRYAEMKNPEKTEFDMMISFLQKEGRGLLFEDYKSVFEQINTSSEPSTMKRKFWRYSDNFLITLAKFAYRQILCNYNLYFKKF